MNRVKPLVANCLLTALCGCFGYVPGEKAYWDAKVKELCEGDGGMKIFETVYLSKEKYALLINRSGKLDPPRDGPDAGGVPIVHTVESTIIHDTYPIVRRTELAVIRTSDRKTLGTSVTYSRTGGDLLGSHPSVFLCPAVVADLFGSTVRQQMEVK